MALLTALPHAQAAILLSRYGLSLAEIHPLTQGSVNSNFEIRGQDGRVFFARIYEEQGVQGAEAEAELLEAVRKVGIQAHPPIKLTDGSSICLFEGKPFALFPWVEGISVCQGMVTPERARIMGEALGRLHAASLELPKLSPSRFDLPSLLHRLEGIEAQGPKWQPIAQGIRSQVVHYGALRNGSLPRGVIHGDLFRDNVLWKPDEGSLQLAALLDFESSSDGPFIYDVMVTLLAWCYGETFEEPLCRAFLGGYQGVRVLSREERRGMLTEGAIACLRFATTRITDFALRTPEGQVPTRDYRRFLKRLAELETAPIEAWLG